MKNTASLSATGVSGKELQSMPASRADSPVLLQYRSARTASQSQCHADIASLLQGHSFMCSVFGLPEFPLPNISTFLKMVAFYHLVAFLMRHALETKFSSPETALDLVSVHAYTLLVKVNHAPCPCPTFFD